MRGWEGDLGKEGRRLGRSLGRRVWEGGKETHSREARAPRRVAERSADLLHASEALSLGTCGDPRGVGVSDERGTPVLIERWQGVRVGTFSSPLLLHASEAQWLGTCGDPTGRSRGDAPWRGARRLDQIRDHAYCAIQIRCELNHEDATRPSRSRRETFAHLKNPARTPTLKRCLVLTGCSPEP